MVVVVVVMMAVVVLSSYISYFEPTTNFLPQDVRDVAKLHTSWSDSGLDFGTDFGLDIRPDFRPDSGYM